MGCVTCLPGGGQGAASLAQGYGQGQGGTVPWEALGSPIHALGVAVGLFLCQGQGGMNR